MKRLLPLLAALNFSLTSPCLAQSGPGISVTSVNGYWPDASGNVTVPFTGAVIGAPTSRTLSLSTAYQATDPSKSALVSINIASTPTLTISGGQTNTAKIYIGATTAVASGTGTAVAYNINSLTGTLVIGVTINAGSTVTVPVFLPPGYYFAILQTSGAVSITSAFDQPIG